MMTAATTTTTTMRATMRATRATRARTSRRVGAGTDRRHRNRHRNRGERRVETVLSASTEDEPSPSTSADETLAALDAVIPTEERSSEREAEAEADAAPTRSRGEISPEMRKKLLGESVGLGGLPEKPMPSNIFLNIILGVFAIVVVAYVGGIRP